ncbi:MAG: prepilin peptidase [Oscillibacter sp.]|jgi:prepilin signal peptidase PulO-like enzyme (type II secretory pathway)|nr:prepilin peptidase [Oscillibacter sp.]
MLHLSTALTAYVLVLAAVLGAVMGSFTSCAAGRFCAGEDWTKGRSHCDACGHTLGVPDLIPIFSWLFLKGRCRHCGAKISVRCPLTELLSAAAFVGVVLRFDVTVQTAQYLILCVILLAVGLVDYDTGIIPDKLLLAIFTDWLMFLPFLNGGVLWENLKTGILAALASSVPLLIVSVIMDKVLGKESMGGGDIKLFFVCGLFFKWKYVLFLLIVSCIFGIVFAVVTGKTTGDAENPRAFPFGPAIVLGVYVSLLAAQTATDAYLRLFL